MRIALTMETDFADSLLPRTMAAAEENDRICAACLPAPEDWPHCDRLLDYLAPDLSACIHSFHEEGGPSLADLLDPDEIEDLDGRLSARLHAGGT